ncbi:MAG TPA: acetate uptake transporter [Ktedonobacterales bacterium]|nr:acetate uptake transporter [Ktedonobacterales bacterium]
METKTANPGPLGLSGFALTTFILSLYNSGILDKSHSGIVVGLAIAYGGIAQFAAGMWEFRAGNTFGATAFTSYGAFWLSFAFLVIGTGLTKDNAPDGTAVGWYLVGWGIFTALMTLGSLRTNIATFLVFALLTATFIVLGVGNLQGTSGIVNLGGYLGLATAIVAWYTAIAGVLASAGRSYLPVFPLTRS